jgi:hydroxypyruvate isomerase
MYMDTETKLPQALEVVKKSGFDAYEFWFWWDNDLELVRKKQDELGLTCVGACAKFLVSTGDAARQDEYVRDFTDSCAAVKKLGAKLLIVQAGWEVPEISREEHRKALVSVLKRIAPIAEEQGITMILEPLNIKVDHAGYHLWDTDETFALVRSINSPNLKVLFDIYHQQISNGNIIASIRDNLDLVGHIHVAGCPGRHEITGGELDYRHIFEALNDMGYDGYVGLEYAPTMPVEQSLLEARKLLI